MITDIKADQKSSLVDFVIKPSKGVRWQSGKPGAGCVVAGTRSSAVRRCRYPTPANERATAWSTPYPAVALLLRSSPARREEACTWHSRKERFGFES